MKSVMVSETLMTYPNHNLPYNINTDVLDYQMGTVLVQNGKAAAYCSKKFNKAQEHYSTMEKELLSI
eukprot:10728730-Ditylum_brightwellii.AAC.1